MREESIDAEEPFRCLGYNRGNYYFLSKAESGVVGLNSNGFTKSSLLRIAPLDYWGEHFPDREVFNSLKATNYLMKSCQRMGVFSMERVRGRGVWLDDTVPVVHFGDRIILSGEELTPHTASGKMIYEAAAPIDIKMSNALSIADAARFPALMERLCWRTPEHALWFTGWIICAMIGGALKWRPHIWITGAAQSGKTTLMNIMRRILGKNSIFLQSVSTEAAIRQMLGSDCLPLLFDEAEREDAHSHSRIQSILTLARASSSTDDAVIAKGTPNGRALQYIIRSCFCMSSINAALMQTADKGRFSVVELSGKMQGEVYQKWSMDRGMLLTDEYISGLFFRAVKMLPILIKNADAFATAIESKTGDTRLGKQYGTLLAAVSILTHDKPFTLSAAEDYIKDITFDQEKEAASGHTDEQGLLDYLLQRMVAVKMEKLTLDYSIAQLCKMVAVGGFDDAMRAEGVLGNYGIRADKDHIYIANKHTGIAHWLKGTPWEGNNWPTTLKRLPFALSSGRSVYFSPACKTWAVMLDTNRVIKTE